MIQRELRRLADPRIAAHSRRFFKTAPGEYGAGDQFLGIRVPQLRQLARHYATLPQKQVEALLHSSWHESRLVALLILEIQSRKGDTLERNRVAKFYLRNLRYVNNWDLVDSSAPQILGPYLQNRSRRLLDQLSRSKALWRRRIAILTTLHFIRQHDFADALRLAKQLLRDEQDLMHKAVGWMLREIGSRNAAAERQFLDRHAAVMPRTMLRYAIEKLPPRLRARYMKAAPA
jgi:3-methyladenine DNA glycosylase AlkD